MGLLLSVTAGLALWIVVWALGPVLNLTSFDGFMMALAVMLLGATGRALTKYLPSRRQ
jgi:hypothetical protein